MAYGKQSEKKFDNTNHGVLFVNAKKSSEGAPDFTGKLDVNGTEFRLAGWKKVSKAGLSFISLNIGEDQEDGEDTRPAAVPHTPVKQVPTKPAPAKPATRDTTFI